jgi:uncharacterized UBP type Zn finger protein
MPLENPPGKMHCFFNATVQLLRVLPEARIFFQRAYVAYRATSLSAPDSQQDAVELLNLIIDLKNDGADNAQTLAAQIFSFEWEVRRVCSVCDQVSRASQMMITFQLVNLFPLYRVFETLDQEILSDFV